MTYRWSTRTATRPAAIGRKYAIASGHHLASMAAMRVLEGGGNAIDAGVAGGIALAVVQPDMVQFSGVAPIIMHLAKERKTLTISGLGCWPSAASINYFERHAGGDLPVGVLRTVVPAAVDAWLTALEIGGTRSFADIVAPAIELAFNGFAVHDLFYEFVTEKVDCYRAWPSSSAIFLPDGKVPGRGYRFVQRDLARTFERLVAAEGRTPGGRKAGLQAVRDEFYQGAIAAEIAAFFKQEGGLLRLGDMASFRVGVEPAVSISFRGFEVLACGPWCQGPMLLEFLNLVEADDWSNPDSATRIHRMTELMKLGLADRECYFGDPDFVDVPLTALLDKNFAATRRAAMSMEEAVIGLPPAGVTDVTPETPAEPKRRPAGVATDKAHYDTSYVCVADAEGNAFSATPSDDSYTSPFVPGLGLVISPRGDQSWLERGHPSALAPRKRPRLTPAPALVFKGGEPFMAFGTPGGDAQCQAMMQVLLNVTERRMDLQSAIEAPRIVSYSCPSSFYPHYSQPGMLRVEGELAAFADEIAARGHVVELWPYRDWRAGGVCAIQWDRENSSLVAAADPRRECSAIAW